MPVKNLMEEIVNAVVTEILAKEKEKIPDYETFRDDAVAYVLNRISPKYFTSERGILHGKLDSKYTIQTKADILFLVYEAISIVKGRRASFEHSDYSKIVDKTSFFPHILGEVLEETTFSVIPDVEVTLLYENDVARMIDESWQNPYVTNKATMSYFHFWPDYNDSMGKKSEIHFAVVFRHDKFEEKFVDIAIPVHSSFDSSNSHIMPITLLRVKESVDIAFLLGE